MKELILLGILGWFSYEDLKKKKLNIWLLGIAGLVGIIFLIWKQDKTMASLLTGCGLGVLVVFISWITKESIGMGDGILLIVTGIFLGGIENLKLLMIGLLYAAVVSLGILIFSKKKGKRKIEIPFAPALFLSYFHDLVGGSAVKGSITVEAAFVISILLMVIIWVLEITLSMYEETVEVALQNWIDIKNIIPMFRQGF